MASSIVTDALAADSRPGVIQEFVGHYFDAFQGDQSSLIHAGLLSAGELEPQPNRAPGYTAFLPGGEPCPVGKKAWRTPGYRAIRQLDDGTIRLEITVSKKVQAERRAAKRAQEYEAEQTRINEALARSEGTCKERNCRRVAALGRKYGKAQKLNSKLQGLEWECFFQESPGLKRQSLASAPWALNL